MTILQDKAALVTGASRGIGRAIAVELARAGAKVAAVFAGNAAAAGETVAEIEALGGTAKAYRCNVAEPAAVTETTTRVLADFGGVDILVNNAGIVRDSLVLNMPDADFDEVLATNLKGAYNTIKALYRPFMKRRWGRIINISSVIGLCGNAGQANYAASKAGLIGLTKSIAKELASRNVTCNAIAPGLIQSDMTSAMPDKAAQGILASIPAGRPGAARDVAALAAFLASDAAGYITGEVIRVDGGLCM